MVAIESLLRSFSLEPTGKDTFRGEHAATGHEVVFGGQLLGQSLLAAQAGDERKTVKTLHTVFARSASPAEPIQLEVDPMHGGRTFASSAVTIRQGERLCARSLVLLSANEDDFIRHAAPAPEVPGPDDCKAADEGDWQMRFAGDVDVNDPALVGPPELDVWTRFAGAPDDPAISQALLAFATDGFLIATAMRPHEGVGQALAHRSISTGVISHTLTFHEPHPAGDWVLLAHRSPYTGHGRCYGRADAFDTAGRLVASYVQDGMIRPLEQGSRL